MITNVMMAVTAFSLVKSSVAWDCIPALRLRSGRASLKTIHGIVLSAAVPRRQNATYPSTDSANLRPPRSTTRSQRLVAFNSRTSSPTRLMVMPLMLRTMSPGWKP